MHTFSDELSGIYTCVTALDEVDCENEGDYVCDTPPTGMDFSCLDACPDIYSPWGLVYEGIPEVSESFMSYAPDACQWMFTQGQIDRMHEQLEIRSTFRGKISVNLIQLQHVKVILMKMSCRYRRSTRFFINLWNKL